MANRNRDKGHRYEVQIMNLFKELGFPCTTSRYSSKEQDDLKVDLCGTSIFNVQCKSVEALGSTHKVLGEMPKDEKYNLLFHHRLRTGTVVSMELDSFKEILGMLIANGIVQPK